VATPTRDLLKLGLQPAVESSGRFDDFNLGRAE